MKEVKEIIMDRNFSYQEPWFYNNEFAFRCELGIGNDSLYMKNARTRANEIAKILFDAGVDCVFFDHYIYDLDSDDNQTKTEADNVLKSESKSWKYSLENQVKYKNHKVIKDISVNKDEDDEGLIRVNRVICYGIENNDLDEFIMNNFNCNQPNVHLVSFVNNCIFSIYDDRGCDIVFFDKDNYIKFYPLLKKYFLDYDKQLMEKKYFSLTEE